MTAPTPNNMPGAGQPPASPAPTAGQPPAATPPAPAAGAAPPAPGGASTPPWGDDPTKYDPDTAARLIANLRASEDGQGKTIKSQSTKIAELEAQIAQAQPLLDAATEQKRREQGELETMRQDFAALQQQLDAAKKSAQTNLDVALHAQASALAATKSFVNPATAVKLLDLADCLVDGQIDETAIASKLDALAQSDPYLVASATFTGRKPNPAQGQGNGSIPATTAQQLAEQKGDVKGAINAVAQNLVTAAKPPQF